MSNGQPSVNVSFPRKDSSFYAVQLVNDTVFVSQGSTEKNIAAFTQSPAHKNIQWEKEISIGNGMAYYYLNTGSKIDPTPTVYLVGPSGVWVMVTNEIELEDTLLSMVSTFTFTK
jgi:hypothetical protein